MATISTAFGSLLEPEVPKGIDPFARFFNAWHATQQVQMQREKLEGEFGKMALKAQHDEWARQQAEDKFNWQMEQGNKLNSIREERIGLERDRVNAYVDKVNDAVTRERRKIEQTQRANEYLHHCGKSPGEMGYDECLRATKQLYPEADLDDEKLNRIHAATVEQTSKNSFAKEMTTLNEFGSRYLGNPKYDESRDLYNIETRTYPAFETEPTEEAKKAGITKTDPMPWGKNDPMWKYKLDPNTGSGIQADGRAFADIGFDPNKGQIARYHFVPTDAIKAVREQLDQIYADRKEIPLPPTVTTDRSRPPIQIWTQADRDALLPGTPYFIIDPATGQRHGFVK